MKRDRGGAVMRMRACKWCGKPFMSSRSHAKCCSVKCRVALHRFNKLSDMPYWEKVNSCVGSRKQLQLFHNGVEI